MAHLTITGVGSAIHREHKNFEVVGESNYSDPLAQFHVNKSNIRNLANVRDKINSCCRSYGKRYTRPFVLLQSQYVFWPAQGRAQVHTCKT